MRTPTRKPGKFTSLKPDPNITLAKYHELKQKLNTLKNHSQPRAAAEVRRLALMGDFSENAAYSIAKGRLRGINQRILDIEDHLKCAVIIKPSQNKGVVTLGCCVTVENNNKEETYQILGSAETNPSRGIISHNSPIGAKLMGRRVGDRVGIKLKDKETEYKIIRIN